MFSSRTSQRVVDADQSNYITAEFSRICQDPIDGIYICPLATNFLEWRGFIMVRAGCYSGGTFRFTIVLPSQFPQSNDLPIVAFDKYVFHPYIDASTRELCLSECFPNGIWRKDKNKISDLLHYIQEVFAILTENFPLDTKPIMNKQASFLFSKDFDNFCLRAEEIVALSRHSVYDLPTDCSDPHLIVFPPYESSKMEPIRRKLLGQSNYVDLPIISPTRTISEFSSRATSNEADADDEIANSDNSFEEIRLDVDGHNFQIKDEFNSVDLNNAPALDKKVGNVIIQHNDDIEDEFDFVSDKNIDNDHDRKAMNNNSKNEIFEPSIAFKVGCESSSSGHEDESNKFEIKDLRERLQNTISIDENVI